MQRLASLLLACALATAPAAAQNTNVGAADASITIDNYAFAPNVITVAPGTKVTWTNHDDMPHSVVGAGTPPPFKSHPLDTDDSFSMVFDKPGSYGYFCGLHPYMQGTVVVK